MFGKRIAKKWLRGVSALFIISSPLWLASQALAASASMSLSASGSFSKGGTLSIRIRENSGTERVNAASATIKYPTSLLSYSYVSNSSAFGVAAATSGGGGSVHVERGALSAVSGTQTIATVNFKVLASSGTASLSFSSGQVLSANTNGNIANSYSGTSVHLTAPAPAPADTIPPKISDVKVSNVTASSATVSWTTTEPANSTVDYGTDKSYGLSASDGNLVTSHKVVLNSSLVEPAKQYHFIVKSADAAGNVTADTDGTFTTEGAKVLVTLTDNKKQPIKGAKVSLQDNTAVTDNNGKATIGGASIGRQTLVASYHRHNYSKTILVAPPDPKNSPQDFAMQIEPSASFPVYIIVIPILLLLGLIAWLIKRGGSPPGLKRFFTKAAPAAPPAAASTSSPVIVSPNQEP
jgi:hypothetical protein